MNRPVRAGRGRSVRQSRDGHVTINADITAMDGTDAPGKTDTPVCDNTGVIGGTGGSVRLASRSGTLAIGNGVKLQAGNGGSGGDCSADAIGQGTSATATAGKGGRGGSVLVGGQNVTFGDNVKVIRGNGGAGGNAEAFGDDGQAPCDDGFAATATGGMGGQAGGVGYIILSPGAITGAPTEEGANGGNGGSAEAFGGDGADCVCGMGDGAGGDGGMATGEGGMGGDGAKGNIWPKAPDSHTGGDGGDADAVGGDGGAGADCCMPPMPGGDGGNGADAVANGGAFGEADEGRNGTLGEGDSFGGDGGDGGDGNGPGAGGAGATATSTGAPATKLDGEAGDPGEECPIPMIDVSLTTDPSKDPSGHEPFVMIASTVTELSISITGMTIVVEGNGNWIPVSGDMDGDGNFIASGSGSTANGSSGVSAQFEGTVELDPMGIPVSVTGTLTVGGNGALPGGMPVIYMVGEQSTPSPDDPPAPQGSTVDFGSLSPGQKAPNSVLQSSLVTGAFDEALFLTTISPDGEGFVGDGALFQDAGTFTYNMVRVEDGPSGPSLSGLSFDTVHLHFLRSQDISPDCAFILSAFGDGPEVDRIEVTSIPDDSEFFWDPEGPAGEPLVFIMSSFGPNCPPNRFVGMTGWTINEPPPVAPNVAGLVPLAGHFHRFPGGQPVQDIGVTVFLFAGSGSGGVIISSVNGLPDGCLGVDLFDPATSALLAHYVSLSPGGCGPLSPPPGMLDGPPVWQNNGRQVQIDFGGLPSGPFDLSLQFNDAGDPNMGMSFTPDGPFDPGLADDLAIWDRVLTAAEVDEVASGGVLNPLSLPEFGGGGGVALPGPPISA